LQNVRGKPPTTKRQRYFNIKKQTHIIFFGLVTFLASCAICGPACYSEIKNKTSKDIYLILQLDTIIGTKTFKHYIKNSNVSYNSFDTVTNLWTLVLPPGGHLQTYDGMGKNPARVLSYLKVVTSKEIFEMKTQNDINDHFDKNGVQYFMTFK